MCFLVEIHRYSDIPPELQNECLELICSGGAVQRHHVERDFPNTDILAFVKQESAIVGVGTVKSIRPKYTSSIANKSDFSFPSDTQELGYIVVHKDYGKRGISGKIVNKILSAHHKPLFSTTDNEWMKRTLTKAGFLEKGNPWKGEKGILTLWMKDPT